MYIDLVSVAELDFYTPQNKLFSSCFTESLVSSPFIIEGSVSLVTRQIALVDRCKIRRFFYMLKSSSKKTKIECISHRRLKLHRNQLLAKKKTVNMIKRPRDTFKILKRPAAQVFMSF
ncbi:hypothetical protein AMECASPLE_038439 [Ameca splendens]|uniref:Uncharacterized protein n=1 Tax=Ameca splendens TaxID=208324 RepID=A0ABV0XX81_9TELE